MANDIYQSTKKGREIDAVVSYVDSTLPTKLFEVEHRITELELTKANSSSVPKTIGDLGYSDANNVKKSEKGVANGVAALNTLGVLPENQIGDNSITSDKLSSGAITTQKISDGSVTEAKLSDSSVSYEKIQNNSINTDKISSNAVTTDKIRDNNVTSSKIADGAISLEKFDDDVIDYLSTIDDEVNSKTVVLENSVDTLEERLDTAESDIDLLQTSKVNVESGKGLSENDYTSAEKTKLAGIETGAQANTVASVSGKTGDITLDKSDVGLTNVDNTSDANKPVSTAQQAALDALGKADVGLGNVDNTSDLDKPMSTATATAISTLNQNINGKLSCTEVYETQLDGLSNNGLYYVVGSEPMVGELWWQEYYVFNVKGASGESTQFKFTSTGMYIRHRLAVSYEGYGEWECVASTQDIERHYNSNDRIAEWQTWTKKWDTLQQNGLRTDYSGTSSDGFFGTSYDNNTFAPKYDIIVTNARYIFQNCQVTDLASELSKHSVLLDFSGITNANDMYYAFYHSRITHIGLIDLSNVSGTLSGTFRAMFGSNIIIDELRLSPNIIWNTGGQSPFFSSPNIISMNVTGAIGRTGFDVSSLTKLDAASIESIIRTLSSETTNYTVYLSNTAVVTAYGNTDNFETRLQELITSGDYSDNWNITLV